MDNDSLQIKIDNKEINEKLRLLADKSKNLRPFMKAVAGIFASSTEDNFKNQGRPKWTDLKESTKNSRAKKKKWPGMILQVEGILASSISTEYDDNSAVIGSNQPYARIHQLGGQAGKKKSAEIPARPYLNLTDNDFAEILNECEKYLTDNY